MTENWPRIALAQLLRNRSEGETVNPFKEYRLLGVRLDNAGPYLRETKLGTELSASTVYKVRAGDFIYSRLFASRGAFGVVDSEFDGCYVSGEFPTFRADPNRLDPNFLRLWFLLPSTLHSVVAKCTGSTPLTRNRFKEEFFLALDVPLPPVDEQRRIVDQLQGLATKTEKLRELQANVRAGLEQSLLAAYLEMTTDAREQPMSEVAPLVRRSVDVQAEFEFREIGIRSYGKGIFHKPPVSGLELGNKRVFRIEPGDLIFNIVFAWEGAVAIAGPEEAGRVGSHRFLSRVPRTGLATASFLRFHFLTGRGLSQLGTASPGGAGRNRTLGLKALDAIRVPVPNFEDQLWFESLLIKSAAIETLQRDSCARMSAVRPAVLAREMKG